MTLDRTVPQWCCSCGGGRLSTMLLSPQADLFWKFVIEVHLPQSTKMIPVVVVINSTCQGMINWVGFRHADGSGVGHGTGFQGCQSGNHFLSSSCPSHDLKCKCKSSHSLNLRHSWHNHNHNQIHAHTPNTFTTSASMTNSSTEVLFGQWPPQPGPTPLLLLPPQCQPVVAIVVQVHGVFPLRPGQQLEEQRRRVDLHVADVVFEMQTMLMMMKMMMMGMTTEWTKQTAHGLP